MQILASIYYWTLSILIYNDFKLYVKGDTNSCFVSKYNSALLKAWQANIDLQPVHIYYRVVSYMTAHFSKTENNASNTSKKNCLRNKTSKPFCKGSIEKFSALIYSLNADVNTRSCLFMFARIMAKKMSARCFVPRYKHQMNIKGY